MKHALPPKPKGMSEVQYTYAVGRAVYETAKAASDHRIKLLYDTLESERENPAFDDLLSAVADKHLAINHEYELDELHRLLIESEDALLDWAEHEIRAHAAAHPRSNEIMRVFADPRARRGIHREKLVDICFKFHFEEARNADR